MKSLKEKIIAREATVAVVGLGYVGLPLACAFATKGYKVIGVDLSEKKVESLKAGESYIIDVKSETLKALVDKGAFSPTTDFSALRNADCISICVPTPLAKTGEPDVSYMINARDYILPHLRKGTLFVLESTTYPGSTKALRVAENLERVLAIELLNAAQALEFRRPLKSSKTIEKFVAEYRKVVEFVNVDKVMYTEIAKSVDFVKNYPLKFDDLKNK